MRQDARCQRLLVDLHVDDRVEEPLDIFRLNAEDGFFLGDQLFIRHVHGDFKRGRRGALAGAGLQHVELPVFDGELHVLHIAVVLLQLYANLFQLVVRLRHDLLQFGEMHRRADAGHHVFALRIDQEVAIEDLFARARVAREAHARSGIVARIAEHHLLHVDAGAEQSGDLLYAAIGESPSRPSTNQTPRRSRPTTAPSDLRGTPSLLVICSRPYIRPLILSSRWPEPRCLPSRQAWSSRRAGDVSRSSLDMPITTVEYICTKRRYAS